MIPEKLIHVLLNKVLVFCVCSSLIAVLEQPVTGADLSPTNQVSNLSLHIIAKDDNLAFS